MTQETTTTEQSTTIEQTTDIAALPPETRAVIVLSSSKTELALRTLVEQSATITEVSDTVGREQAHRAAMSLRNARTSIQKTGKAARDDATKFSAAVIAEEKRLIAITEAEEKRVFDLRDAFDAKVEAEKEAKRQAEAARVAEIKGKIDGIRGLPAALAGSSSDEIQAEQDALAAFTPLEEVFGEFLPECLAALREVGATLADMRARVKAQEDAAAAVRAEAERMAEAERAAAEKLAAERQALEDERAAIARERAELEALRAAAKPVQVEMATTEPVAVELVQQPATVDEMHEIGQGIRNDPEPAAETGAAVEPSDWRIRNYALATARQFKALADKVQACGAINYANELRGVAETIEGGAFDHELSGADSETLVRFDNEMIDATVAAVDALTA
jgi:hypothetical protein